MTHQFRTRQDKAAAAVVPKMLIAKQPIGKKTLNKRSKYQVFNWRRTLCRVPCQCQGQGQGRKKKKCDKCKRVKKKSSDAFKCGLNLTSRSIRNCGKIPIRFTCDGIDVNPSFTWKSPRKDTASFALLVDDPDAIPNTGGCFSHMAVINLPPTLRSIAEAQDFSLIPGSLVLANSFGIPQWDGPCPPPIDCAHTYRFTLYALRSLLPVTQTGILTVETFEYRYSKLILGKSEFFGFYRALPPVTTGKKKTNGKTPT